MCQFVYCNVSEYPGNVFLGGKYVLSGKRRSGKRLSGKVPVRETTVYHFEVAIRQATYRFLLATSIAPYCTWRLPKSPAKFFWGLTSCFHIMGPNTDTVDWHNTITSHYNFQRIRRGRHAVWLCRRMYNSRKLHSVGGVCYHRLPCY